MAKQTLPKSLGTRSNEDTVQVSKYNNRTSDSAILATRQRKYNTSSAVQRLPSDGTIPSPFHFSLDRSVLVEKALEVGLYLWLQCAV